MSATELLLLHGLEGGSQKMASKRASYGASRYDPATNMYVSRSTGRKRSRRVSGLGSLGAFGQSSSLKGMLGGVKGVLITGSIAAGGAILTDRVFDKVAEKWEIEGWKRDAAKMAFGIALAILIAKVTKKPKLAAAFAIGPVVAGAMRIFGGLMGDGTAGLGLNTFTPSTAFNSMYSPLYGADDSLGLTTFDPITGPPAAIPPIPASVSSVVAGV